MYLNVWYEMALHINSKMTAKKSRLHINWVFCTIIISSKKANIIEMLYKMVMGCL